MPQITIRGGPGIQAATRRVNNIIYDSAAEVELQYINYYYPENTRGNADSLDPMQVLKPFSVIRSNLLFNNLELDFRDQTTSSFIPIGIETSTDYPSLPKPSIDSYTAQYDELYPGQFQAILNNRKRFEGDLETNFIVLEGDFRKTATKPIKHFHNSINPIETSNDVFHFSINSTNVITNNPRIRVKVFRSLDTYETAIEDLDNFQSGLSSQLLTQYDFSVENDTGWTAHSIDIRNISMEHGACLLWFTFERIPELIENPFDINSGEYTENFHVVNDDVYSSNIWISSIDDWIDNDTIITRPFTIEIDGTQLIYEVDFTYQLVKHREINRKLEITFLTSLEGLINGVLNVQPRTTGVNSYGILNSWHRFSHGPLPTNGIATYPNRPDELNSWTVDSNDDIKSTENSRSYIGFVSPEPINSYVLEVDVNSTASDDDTVGVIVGYVKENDYEYTLSAVRTHGGMFGGETWMLATNIGQSINFSGNIVSSHVSSHMWTNELPPANPIDIAGGWQSTPNGTRIKVEKNENIVKIYTSQMNSTTIDPQTLIEIDLNDYEDTKRFINSRFGFSTYSQRNASFSNISFEPLIEGGISLSDAKQGQLFVGAFALEQAQLETFTRNPKTNFEFIESIDAEKYVIENSDNIVVEKYNNYTFELSTAEEQSENFVDLINPYRYAGTILDYNNISMILKSKKVTFEFSPFTGGRLEYLTAMWSPGLYGGIGLMETISEFVSISDDVHITKSIIEQVESYDSFKNFLESIIPSTLKVPTYLDTVVSNELELKRNIDTLISSETEMSSQIKSSFSIKENVDKKIIEVGLSGMRYEFEYPKSDMTGIFDRGSKELTLSEFVGMADLSTTKKYGYELNTSYNILEEQDLVLDTKKGLYFFRPVDYLNDITKSMYFGKPKDTIIPINYGFQKYTDSALEFERFTEIARDIIFKYDNFIETPEDTALSQNDFVRSFDDSGYIFKPFFEQKEFIIVNDKNFERKVTVIQYDFPKTSYFERSKDIQFKVAPYYTEVLDKTYVNKLFFVDLDMWNSHLEFKPFKLSSDDVSYMIEQFFLKSSVVVPNKTNIFGKQMLEEIFRPNYREIERIIEFFFDSFVGISSNIFDVNKFQPSFYDKIISGHMRSDGSAAYGYETLKVGSNSSSKSLKNISIDYSRENAFEAAGRSGRHTTSVYKETQEVTDINSSFLFEFSDVEWDLDLASTKNEVWGFNRENSNFNFIYQIDESSGRLPDCLNLSTEGIISGTLTETDKFLREYAFEDWTKTQGFIDNDGNFISHNESLDYDYTDFDPITPREFSVKIVGTNITKGTIDLIPTNDNGIEYVAGEKITQGDTVFYIGQRLGSFQKEVNLGSGTETVTVIRHEIERLLGDINVNRTEIETSDVFVTSSSILSNNISQLNEEIIYSESTQETEVLLEKRNALQDILANVGSQDGIFAQINTQENVVLEVVKNENNLSFYVDDFTMDNSGAVVKEITLVFKIHNNYSFDRDLFLHTSEDIDTEGYATRTEWLNARRESKEFRYDPILNNSTIDAEILETIKNFRDSKLDIDEYLFKKNYLIGAREFTSPDEKTKYETFIDSIVFKETKFSNNYIVNTKILNSIDIEYFNRTFKLDITLENRFKYLEDISDENGNFKLNCNFNVDEKTFYDNTDDIRVIRGYPVYASCN